jgi:hypothetical protein
MKSIHRGSSQIHTSPSYRIFTLLLPNAFVPGVRGPELSWGCCCDKLEWATWPAVYRPSGTRQPCQHPGTPPRPRGCSKWVLWRKNPPATDAEDVAALKPLPVIYFGMLQWELYSNSGRCFHVHSSHSASGHHVGTRQVDTRRPATCAHVRVKHDYVFLLPTILTSNVGSTGLRRFICVWLQ